VEAVRKVVNGKYAEVETCLLRFEQVSIRIMSVYFLYNTVRHLHVYDFFPVFIYVN